MKAHVHHIPEKHQSVAPDKLTILALAIVAAVLVTIYVSVSLAS
jgi:hypothetical protein